MFSSLSCAAQQPAVSSEASYLSFEVPGALGTYPMSINNSMTVTGYFVSSAVTRGFVRDGDGAITTFTVPGSGQTIPSAINDAGEIAGSYIISPGGGPQLCFLRARDGSITTFTPAASSGTAVVTGINEMGTVVGYYTDDFSTSSTKYGFIRHRDGVVETIAVEGSAQTQIASINAAGDVTGWYLKSSYISGYVRSAHGKVTTFDLGTALLPTSINDAGTITGYYLVPVSLDDNWNHEFIRSPDGGMTTFTPPGTIWPGFLGINDDGMIAGNYQLPPSASNPAVYFAFVRRRDGEITTIAPESGWQTMTTGINRAGVITGYSYNAIGAGEFGFLRIPARRPGAVSCRAREGFRPGPAREIPGDPGQTK